MSPCRNFVISISMVCGEESSGMIMDNGGWSSSSTSAVTVKVREEMEALRSPWTLDTKVRR